MDREARRAAVHGVAKSWTRLATKLTDCLKMKKQARRAQVTSLKSPGKAAAQCLAFTPSAGRPARDQPRAPAGSPQPQPTRTPPLRRVRARNKQQRCQI